MTISNGCDSGITVELCSSTVVSGVTITNNYCNLKEISWVQCINYPAVLSIKTGCLPTPVLAATRLTDLPQPRRGDGG